MKSIAQTLFSAVLGFATFGTFVTFAQAQLDVPTLLVSPLRMPADSKADVTRKPTEFLTFTQAQAGMKVLDIAAGGGYTSQLLTLAVGNSGQVWAQNEKPSANLKARLDAHPQTNLTVLVRPFEDPYAANLPPLDLITIVLSYHDIAFTSTNRNNLTAHLLQALKPGGHLVIIDHSAKHGSGLDDIKTMHRIDEAVVIQEVSAAGFKLEAESSDWRNASDTLQEHSGKMASPSDRFALRFVKP
jgi:predicted methyltransferase